MIPAHHNTRGPIAFLAILAISMMVIFVPSAHAQGLPVQDNELVLGVTAGPLLVEQPTDNTARTLELRIGVTTEFTLGLMNRATDWLDAELLVGFVMLILAEQGFEQRSQAGPQTRNVLPGALLRGTLRARVFPAFNSWTFGLSGTVLFIAAPATGAFTRLEIEATTGYEILRRKDDHLLIEVGYAFPLLDGLRDEPGVEHTTDVHRVLVRITYGF